MFRIEIDERPNWRALADEYGFKFHTMYGEAYWDESAYYQFTLQQIEEHLEDPTEALHQMCLDVVDRVVRDEQLMQRFAIPGTMWDAIADSWRRRDPSLYSRLDFCYPGNAPAKLLENNADTPTSVYETAFWQWLWLADSTNSGKIRRDADQFNSLQEKLIQRFAALSQMAPHVGKRLYFSCVKESEEDRGTVQYLQDCAEQAGIECSFIFIEDIGHGLYEVEDDNGGGSGSGSGSGSGERVENSGSCLTDLDDQPIEWLFKLYPWEFMFVEEYSPLIVSSPTAYLEPLWKSVLSNKALLVLLWQMFPNHPNLLPAFFEDDPKAKTLSNYVRKPIFSREGCNIELHRKGKPIVEAPGPYGEEGFILQDYRPLPKFGEAYTLVGSWIVDGQPAGIGIREDASLITQDLSRFLPHIIQG